MTLTFKLNLHKVTVN